MREYSIKFQKLDSGYLRIEFDNAFCQIPPGFTGIEIPDEYIFESSYNRRKINQMWAFLHEQVVQLPLCAKCDFNYNEYIELKKMAQDGAK